MYVDIVIYAVKVEQKKNKELVLYFYFINVFFFISVIVFISGSLYILKLLMMLFYVKQISNKTDLV